MAGVRPDQHIIEGNFEIDHGPWTFLCGLKQCLAIRIYSSENVNPSTGKGLESDAGHPSFWKLAGRERFPVVMGIGRINLPTRITKFKLKFKVVMEFGSPGAFVVENKGKKKFFLKSATLRNIVPKQENVLHFNCNSWVYPLDKTKVKRVFFINRLYLPRETPPGLKEFRKKELEKLRGGGSQGERKPWDRIYEYDFYNDLGDPDKGREYSRPVLGGSVRFPYPRRLRTGRPPCQQDHLAESPPAECSQMYVPPDERLSNEKLKELKNNFVDALVRFLTPKSDHPALLFQEYPDLIKKFVRIFIPSIAFSPTAFRRFQTFVHFFTRKPKSAPRQDTRNLDTMDDIFNFFSEKEVKKLEGVMKKLEKLVPNDILKRVVDTTAATKGNLLNSQIPSIIAEDKYAWLNSDGEFGRQLLAGTNPVRIRLLKCSEIPSGINWFRDPGLGRWLEGWFPEWVQGKEAFILDHSDYLMPYLHRINGSGSVCAYASRTFLLQWGDGTIRPIAIELGLPDPNGRIGYTLDDGPVWLLAKAHVAANDAAHHQLVSHWLHTHAIIEPFIIATRRQLSVMHPIHRLLDPHFKDTLHINALARAIFLNAGGILETTLFTGEFSMSLSSDFYKEWRFDDQALPNELVKRGMAKKEETGEVSEKPAEKEPEKQGLVEREDVVERDEGPGEKDDKTPDEKVKSPGGVKLILEDYPYAKDGLEIWDAIETWVTAYCEIFYASDGSVTVDEEIQAWWNEIRNEGHGDQEEGWYELKTCENLVRALTTLIWITSGLHAAVNFGQYAYAGWPPNRPMLLRKFIPEPNTQEFEELQDSYPIDYKFLIQMWPETFQMEFVIAVMDLLSRHTSEEVYLGQRPPENEEDQKGKKVNEESEVFRKSLEQVEGKIKERNKKYSLMNRWGEAKIPYKLLLPDTSKAKPLEREGIIGRGIPNNISI